MTFEAQIVNRGHGESVVLRIGAEDWSVAYGPNPDSALRIST
jgi:hypothetical protein